MASDLPEVNVEFVQAGKRGGWTAAEVRGVLCNAAYAGVKPFPALLSDGEWAEGAARMIAQEGAAQFLVNMLSVTRMAFGPACPDEIDPNRLDDAEWIAEQVEIISRHGAERWARSFLARLRC